MNNLDKLRKLRGLYIGDGYTSINLKSLLEEIDKPIDMVLHCRSCGMQHIDAPEPGKLISGGPNAGRVRPGWDNPPHRSHRCAGCGYTWRPADVPTNGVAAVKTQGKNDSPECSGPLLATPDDTIELRQMEARKDAAYLERNQLVAALSKLFPSGVRKTTIEGWSPDWHGCVYIDLPTGQVSWHFHDSQASLFSHLPEYPGVWDGHDTEEKYRRLAALEQKKE